MPWKKIGKWLAKVIVNALKDEIVEAVKKSPAPTAPVPPSKPSAP